MKKAYLSHWPFFITGPVLSLCLILFWFFNQRFLSETKGPVSALLENPLLTFGLIIFGAFLSAFISGEFSIKTPRTYAPLAFAFLGGIVMGIGAAVASMSVHSVVLFNLAGIFNLTAFMITKGWIYALCMTAGGFTGSIIFVWAIGKTSRLKKEFHIPNSLQEQKGLKKLFLVLLGAFSFFLVLISLFSVLSVGEKQDLLVVVALLLIFGMIVERGTICMSSMLKEWFIARSAYVWRSVLFTIMCLAVMYQFGIKASFYQAIEVETHVRHFWLLAGGSFLMGIGFIFADGCFIGSLWKAGQGNLVNFAGIYGMLIGIGASQFALKQNLYFMRQSDAGILIPNHISTIIDPLVFLAGLWAIGLLFLFVFRRKKYRYG